MQVQADLDALKSLRESLRTFGNRQADALESADSEIARTASILDDAEQHWRYEVEQRSRALQECLREARYAAQQGYCVDCSGYEYALREAEEKLTRVVQWHARVQSAISQYRSASGQFHSALQNDLPRATSYLADRITALEAYNAAGVLATATALAGAGVAGIMGGVIAAVRYSQGELSRVMGSMGEQVAAQVLSEKFGLQEIPFDQPKHGFDRVFRAPGMPLVVMESKVNSRGELHLGQTQMGEQGSPEWIAAQADQMADRTSAQASPANARIAELVRDLGAENVPAMTVVVNPSNGLSDVYTRQPQGDWQLLQGGIRLDQLSSPAPTIHPELKEGNWGGAEHKG